MKGAAGVTIDLGGAVALVTGSSSLKAAAHLNGPNPLDNRVMKRTITAVAVIVFGLWSAPAASQAKDPAPEDPSKTVEVAERRLIERFQLFPTGPEQSCCEISGRALSEPKRLLHQPGDPDSLFTTGSPTPQGKLHLQAAVEVNEVVLRALAPDLRVDPSDTRFRSAGDYRALDATGRPYQFRLGAKFVW